MGHSSHVMPFFFKEGSRGWGGDRKHAMQQSQRFYEQQTSDKPTSRWLLLLIRVLLHKSIAPLHHVIFSQCGRDLVGRVGGGGGWSGGRWAVVATTASRLPGKPGRLPQKPAEQSRNVQFIFGSGKKKHKTKPESVHGRRRSRRSPQGKCRSPASRGPWRAEARRGGTASPLG